MFLDPSVALTWEKLPPAYSRSLSTSTVSVFRLPCAGRLPDGIVQQHYVNNTDTDTQAMIFRLDPRKELVLAIPGTASIKDWDTDNDLRLVEYTDPKAWKSIQDEVERELASSLETHPDYTVTTVGHSLGGALSELAFGSLGPKPLNVTQVITHGAPRVGNMGFADYFDRLAGATDANPGISYRVTHWNDLVPHLYPFLLGSIHPRTEYFQSSDTPDAATTYRCYGYEAMDCAFGQQASLVSQAHLSYAAMKSSC
ncbi:Lipase, class 3 [Metarhizium album ARSEF 1941]|uniref:Lipase, class 3 n=1 Tax=Metarhizium album (strain ARSEF 1941) TaxID=1081103 RepID=A0A0B2WTY4_METAS|nr:Lipase, class 3 [Metarhizium album ARSEF 1941]KHN96380.1 Lipase, class 3 [Metarhizium album ARSEF 1941]